MMIELIKNVTDKVARSNQEDLEVERANQSNVLKQILEGVNKTQKLAKYKRKCSNLKEQVNRLKNQQN